MADDRTEPREVNWRQLLPWTELFRGFQVALDLNKLLLAAAGIVTMAIGWWLLSIIFTANDPKIPPGWHGTATSSWAEFKHARDHWNLMHEAAGIGDGPQFYTVEDIASTQQEYELFNGVTTPAQYQERIEQLVREGKINPQQEREFRAKANVYARLGREK